MQRRIETCKAKATWRPAGDRGLVHGTHQQVTLPPLTDPRLNTIAYHSTIFGSSEIFKSRDVQPANDTRLPYLLLQALLSVKQEKEIQMKMIVTRGESVLQSTSPEGIPALQQQLQSVKDMWASLLSAGIRCKR